MLDGVDDIDWAALDRPCHDPGDDIPSILRRLGSADIDTVRDALDAVIEFSMRDSCVYPTTVAMIPYLVEVATIARHYRVEILRGIGFLTDDVHVYGWVDETRAALRLHAGLLIPLLGDADPEIRDAAAFTLRQAGDACAASALWRRWEIEGLEEIRISVLFALVAADPDSAADVARDVLVHGSPSERVGAALALHRAGVEPGEGAAALVVDALEGGGEVGGEWCREPNEILTELGGGVFSHDVIVAAASSDAALLRLAAIRAADDQIYQHRSAATGLLPIIAGLLDDPEEAVRAKAAGLFARAGAAGARFADALARLAGRLPTVEWRRWPAEFFVARALALLGDPRWVHPVSTTWQFSHGAVLFTDQPGRHHTPVLPITGPVLRELRRELDDAVTAADTSRARFLVNVITHAGPGAHAAEPELRAAADLVPDEARTALVATGTADDNELSMAAADGDTTAAVVRWRRTGDTEPLTVAIRAAIADNTNLVVALTAALPAAHTLGGLATDLRTVIADRRSAQLRYLAAQILYRATGDAVEASATASALMERTGHDAAHGCDLAGEIRDPAAAPKLRALLRDRYTGLAAAHALVQLGEPLADYLPWYTAAITASSSHREWRTAITRCIETRSPALITALQDLATRDERVIRGGYHDLIVWEDEALQSALTDAVRQLSRSA